MSPFFSTQPSFVYMGESLFSVMKIFAVKLGLLDWFGSGLLHPYFLVVVFLTSAFSWFIIFAEAAEWKKVFVAVTMMLVLPHVSFDYKMLHVVLPLLLFLNQKDLNILSSKAALKQNWQYLLLFIFLLIPKSYHYLFKLSSTGGGIPDVSESSILNPLVFTSTSILFCLTAVLYRRWRLPGSPGADRF
jgi:hypothetical protein